MRARRRPIASRTIWLVISVVAGALIIVVGVFPVSTYLRQRSELDTSTAMLSELRAENAAFEERLELLATDREIERLARRDHQLVYEGEEAYSILPPTPTPVEVPDVWPLNRLGEALAG